MGQVDIESPPIFDCGRCEEVYWHRRQQGDRNKYFHSMQFIVCPDCDNKRCPRATDHRLACTNSNSPNQPGSDHYFLDTWPEVEA